MLWWDYVIPVRAEEMRQLSHAQLAELSTRVIEETIKMLTPGLTAEEPQPVVELVVSVAEDCRATAPQWRLSQEYLAEFTRQMDVVYDDPEPPGWFNMQLGILSLVDGLTRRLDTKTTLDVLSSCYATVLLSQPLSSSRITPDDERGFQRCREALALQQELISTATRI